ncbi:MAG TPA: ligase-associated DNA damage response endonuclease PdeM [Flavisolibacter sp.]|jgi:DNA ligase-associated metallophosphoesterase|nr:ligase-associated DNA damage response endonuclease PdeM [Flavisolibacter sp.]
MEAPILHEISGQHLWLSAYRSIYWEEQKALLVSDLHFGKTGHFRKSGIAVPQHVYKEDLQRLVTLLDHFKPAQLIVVGDFFHSHANTELEWFTRWRQDFESLEIILVKGNHDILKTAWYDSNNITVIDKELRMGPFQFTHDVCDASPGYYTFCGHIHPGIVLQGLGKQTLRFPCFYFNSTHCILPAFSKFTGTVSMQPKTRDQVFAIVENKLIRMQ